MSDTEKMKVAVIRARLNYPSLDAFVSEYGVNISPSGFLLDSSKPMDIGSIVKFVVTISDDSVVLRGLGKVARIQKANEVSQTAGMEVKFLKLDGMSKETVRKVLRSKKDAQTRGQSEDSVAYAAPVSPDKMKDEIDVPSRSPRINNTEVTKKEVLFAIRMNWLIWLSKPIRFIWNAIVQVALAFWHLFKLSALSMKGLYTKEILKRSILGSSFVFATIFLFVYLAGILDLIALSTIGMVLSILPIAWTIGEVTAVLKAGEDKGGETVSKEDIPKGNGFRVVGTIFLSVLFIIFAIGIQALLSYLSAIPGIGPIFLGIILIPNVALSIMAIVVAILLFFSIMVLPSKLLQETVEEKSNPFKRWYTVNQGMLSDLAGKGYWLQLLIISPIASFFAFVVAIPMILLVISGFGLTTGVITAVTSFSETARASLLGLSVLISGSYGPISGLQVSVKIGLIFSVLSLSLVLGAAFSPIFSGLASIYYRLFNGRTSNKTWVLVVLAVLTSGGLALIIGTVGSQLVYLIDELIYALF